MSSPLNIFEGLYQLISLNFDGFVTTFNNIPVEFTWFFVFDHRFRQHSNIFKTFWRSWFVCLYLYSGNSSKYTSFKNC